MREAVSNDIEGVANLGYEAMMRDPYDLDVSYPKLVEVATECIEDEDNFCWVVEESGVITGAVSGVLDEMLFYEGLQLSIVQYYCTTKGEGVNLIRKCIKWAKTKDNIKMICFTVEYKADPRISSLLERLGLTQELPIHIGIM